MANARWLARMGSAIRDGWIIAGVTLLLFIVLELGYQAVHGRKTASSLATTESGAPTPRLHPYAGQSWFQDFKGPKGLDARHNHFDAYRSFWPSPLHSRYINIDSVGFRSTPQPVPDTAGTVRVLMLGGSTMWGYTARDSFTIPTLTAARLRAHGILNAHVVNSAQAAYNATQEATTLLVERAHGDRADIVVLLDGYNDIATGLKFREAGHSYGDEDIDQQIHLGTRTFWGELFGLARHSEIVGRLQSMVARPAGNQPAARPTAAVCGEVGQYFAKVSRQVEELGAAGGFPVVYFQQPMLATTKKPLTAWEHTIPPRPAVHECADSIDAAMADRAGRSYFSLRSVFDFDTASAFIDEHGHITEAANGEVAEQIATVIAPILMARQAAAGHGPASAASRPHPGSH